MRPRPFPLATPPSQLTRRTSASFFRSGGSTFYCVHAAKTQKRPESPRRSFHFDPSARRGPSGPPMDGFFSWGTFSPVFQPSHGDITSPLYTAATATALLWSRPSARAGTGHVAKTSSCCGATACPTGSRTGNGTGLDATHPPRIWSVSPSDSLPGSVTARGHAWLQLTWFTLKSSLSRSQWR